MKFERENLSGAETPEYRLNRSLGAANKMRSHQRGSLKSLKYRLKLSNPTEYHIGDHAMLIGSHFHGMLELPKFVSHSLFLPFTVNFVVQPKNVDFRPNTIFRVKFLLNFFQSDKKFVTCRDNTVQNKSSLENFTVISGVIKNSEDLFFPIMSCSLPNHVV